MKLPVVPRSRAQEANKSRRLLARYRPFRSDKPPPTHTRWRERRDGRARVRLLLLVLLATKSKLDSSALSRHGCAVPCQPPPSLPWFPPSARRCSPGSVSIARMFVFQSIHKTSPSAPTKEELTSGLLKGRKLGAILRD